MKSVIELDALHDRGVDLGGVLRLDRSDDDEEPLPVYTDLDGHPFCVFVAGSRIPDNWTRFLVHAS